MKKSILSLLLVGLLLSRAPLATAKDAPVIGGPDSGLKPVAVVSIASYDRLISDIAFIAKIAKMPDLDKQAEGLLTVFAQGLNGLDKTRPWGVIVSADADGGNFPRVGFLPVTDGQQLLASLQGVLGPATDAGNGIFTLQLNNLKIYVKEQTGWVFISDTSDTLADLPKDPTKWLEGLDKKFELGVQFHIANVPEMFRSMAIDNVKDGLRHQLEQQPGEDDDTFELRQKLAQSQLKSLEDIINDADQFTIGWAIDQENKSTSLDVALTARPNSPLAKNLAGLKNSASNYSGFNIAKAAVATGISQAIAKSDAQQVSAMVDGLKVNIQQEIDKSDDLPDAETKTSAKDILNDLAEALNGTFASGKFDGGLSLLLGSKTFTGVAGLYIADPARVESALKKVSALRTKDPDNIPKINFNADKYGDVRFHTAKFPVPADDDMAKVVGSTMDVAVGIGPKSVYLGVGTDALASLKKSIDKSKADAAKVLPPGSVVVTMQPIIEFSNALEPNPLNKALATELTKTPDKDHIQLVAKPISNGVNYHLEIQEAVLNLIGVAVKMNSMPNQPPGGLR